MKKNYFYGIGLLLLVGGAFILLNSFPQSTALTKEKIVLGPKNKPSMEDRALFNIERVKYEYNMQVNPLTGTIPKEDKARELALAIAQKQEKTASALAYTFRGPGNLGGEHALSLLTSPIPPETP
ncbi:hypothetical protein [Croceiramulus getboli]|nr:hypothetical protein P8624_00845 [Flavobacteriaceae bacterium YJPT1-3]